MRHIICSLEINRAYQITRLPVAMTWFMIFMINCLYCLKFLNFTQILDVEVLRKSVETAFPQNFHSRKLGVIAVFYAVV